MPKERSKRSVSAEALIRLTAVLCFLALAAIALSAQNRQGRTASKTNAVGLLEAKVAFDNACASCHGLDARGGERGPDLVSRRVTPRAERLCSLAKRNARSVI